MSKRAFGEEKPRAEAAEALPQSWPEGQKGKIVSKKKIDKKMITLPANLVGLIPATLQAAATRAISRLQTMSGPSGVVVILSFSHTTILGRITGHTSSKKIREDIVGNVVKHNRLSREPESMGLTLETMECFNPPAGMNLYKQNVASIGAKSCMGSMVDNSVPVDEAANYYLQIFRIVQTDMRTDHETLDSLASSIFNAIETTFKPIFLDNHREMARDAQAVYDSIIKYHEEQGLDAAARLVPLQKIKELATLGIQIHNLESGLAFRQQHVTASTCMLNKKYLRLDTGREEHYPALDWHVTAIGRNGILIGNVLHPTRPNSQSTQIPDDMHAAIMQRFPSGQPDQVEKASWMMDLITAIKIIRGIDVVTTRDILEVLHENGVLNVIFVDGGCNEFRDQTSGESIACADCDPSLQVTCETCSGSAGTHPFGGGMKNKKPTKKRVRNGRTVRSRKMRKRSKRYKRYKTYKR
jgi:hypothetical protein